MLSLPRRLAALVTQRAPVSLRLAEPFQDGTDALFNAPPPRWMHGAIPTIAALFAALLVLASVISVEIIVKGGGRLAADAPTVVLQPMERAVLREVLVRPGQAVQAGQVLARLDPTFSQADLDALGAQARLLESRIARLVAEQSGTIPPAAELADEAGLAQAQLFRIRQALHAARLRAFDEEIARQDLARRTAEADIALLERQLGLAREVEAMRAQLFGLNLVSRVAFAEAQAARIRAEREWQQAQTRPAELRHQLEARGAERAAFADHWQSEVAEALSRDRAELARLREALVKAGRMREMVTIAAPVDGIVLDVAQRSGGSVLREAEPLISLLPADAPMVVEAMVASRDIGYLRLGDAVSVKIEAFPFQRHGTLAGRVRAIGEESVDPARASDPLAGAAVGLAGGGFHRVTVTLEDARLPQMREGTRLFPGMTATAEINVGRRSVISYLLRPITRALDESLREP